MVIVLKASPCYLLGTSLKLSVLYKDEQINSTLKMRWNLVESFLKLRTSEMYYWNKFSQENQEQNEIVRFSFLKIKLVSRCSFVVTTHGG